MANNHSAQVRRDLMQIGYNGSPKKGYFVDDLITHIRGVLEKGGRKKIVLAGIGNLGRAFLSYFSYRQPGLDIVAAFDTDESKINRVIAGCRTYHINELERQISELGATIGIITVPAQEAQSIAERLVDGGIKAILNFAPVPIKVPEHIYRGRLDITMELEKLSFLTSNIT